MDLRMHEHFCFDSGSKMGRVVSDQAKGAGQGLDVRFEGSKMGFTFFFFFFSEPKFNFRVEREERVG